LNKGRTKRKARASTALLQDKLVKHRRKKNKDFYYQDDFDFSEDARIYAFHEAYWPVGLAQLEL